MNNSRRVAAFILEAWLKTGEFPSRLLPAGKDRSFVQDMVYTTVRRLRPLRKVLGELVAKWPKGELEALLLVGAAQILYMDDVADHAAVNETVEAAKCCENKSIAKVVNGVLRNLIRRRGEFTELLAASPIDVRESFPSALYMRWVARFGAENAERLAKWHNIPGRTFLARKDGTFTELERGVKIEDVQGYETGEFIVQDPATALAVELVDAKAGDEVFDACAAPGGKTVQLAWRSRNVTACEVNPKRRARLEENLRRIQLSVPVLTAIPSKGERIFTKILVDAPCTNTGVLRRRPDARWSWSVDKMNAAVKLQSEILDTVAPLLAKGGRLVYSTCSNEPEENVHQITAFLKRHPDFRLVEDRESLPFETDFDGAYAAAIERF